MKDSNESRDGIGNTQCPKHHQKQKNHIKEKMIFYPEAHEKIRKTVGTRPAETGGILLGSRYDFIIQKFVFDKSGSCTPGGYDPDVDFLNRIVKKEWKKNRLALIGFVHSHPRGVSRLSGDWGNGFGDIGYLKKIFEFIPALDKFLVPIIYSTADGRNFEIFPYIARRGAVENYIKADVCILDKTPNGTFETERETAEIQKNSDSKTSKRMDSMRLNGAVDVQTNFGP